MDKGVQIVLSLLAGKRKCSLQFRKGNFRVYAVFLLILYKCKDSFLPASFFSNGDSLLSAIFQSVLIFGFSKLLFFFFLVIFKNAHLINLRTILL